jgi:hypothetical protein
LRDSFGLDGLFPENRERRLDGVTCRSGDQKLAADGVALDATREIDVTPHHAVLGSFARANIARDDFSGVDPDTHFELRQPMFRIPRVHSRHRQLHLERACHSPLGVVWSLERCTEDSEDRVANELVDRAVVLLDHRRHLTQVVVQ